MHDLRPARPKAALARALAFALLTIGTHAMAIDLSALWDFSNPALSEQRFRDALATASGDDGLILQTQIARSHGLRRDFAKAREVLAGIEPAITKAGAEARTRYWLELGRSHWSATHRPAELTADAKASARQAYERALDIAKGAQLDGLAIDAIHMFAFIDTAPADQLRWAQAALAVVEASSQPAAKAWEGSIRNNLGYALQQLGRYPEALAEFERAQALRERGGNARSIRIARWMVAWTLRSMNRTDEALEQQHRLEQDWQAAGETDPYVYEELAHLYRSKGNAERAAHYDALLAAHRNSTKKP